MTVMTELIAEVPAALLRPGDCFFSRSTGDWQRVLTVKRDKRKVIVHDDSRKLSVHVFDQHSRVNVSVSV